MLWVLDIKKPPWLILRRLWINTAATYSPRDKAQVPSAMRDLTSLFGMGRGEHPRYNHHKNFNKLTYWEVYCVNIKNKAYG